MSDQTQAELVEVEPICPRCFSALKSTAVCDRCGWLDLDEDSTQAAAGRKSINRDDIRSGTQRSFTIGSVMLITTLLAVLLAIFMQVPGLGVTLFLFALPAFVRTASLTCERLADGGRSNRGQQVIWFLSRFAMSALLVASFAASTLGAVLLALLVVCTAMLPGTGSMSVETWTALSGWSLAVAAASAAFVTAFMWLRKYW